MKKLEELGISPAPWQSCDFVAGDIGIASANGVRIGEAVRLNDWRLIAAAPELYEALREAVIEMCHDCPSCGQYPDYDCNGDTDCFVRRWRDVLAKAGGAE